MQYCIYVEIELPIKKKKKSSLFVIIKLPFLLRQDLGGEPLLLLVGNAGFF